MARLGSLFEDLHIATVDWSEASDRIWLYLVEALMSEGFCSGWFSFMSNVCRCKSTSVKFQGSLGQQGDFASLEDLEVFLSEHTDSFSIKMHKNGISYTAKCVVATSMFATMGNPITFPLQTLVFWAFLEACTDIYACENDMNRDELTFCSSFGDDGVVDSRVIGTVEKYATWLNWKLNLDKSFSSGGFRESCGGDYYCGRMVRPFQPKRPPLDEKLSDGENKKRFQAWLYVLYNNTSPIVERMGHLPERLSLWVNKYHKLAKLGKICLVPPDYPDGSGVRISNSCLDGIPYYTSSEFSPSDWAFYRRWETGPCFCALDEYVWPDYHNPYYNVDGTISFKCLTSLPPKYGLDPDLECHYYHDALKQRSGDNIEDYAPTLAFFDITVKGSPRLDSDGDILRKECRIRKTDGTVGHWPTANIMTT
jgi:hypothetical protein